MTKDEDITSSRIRTANDSLSKKRRNNIKRILGLSGWLAFCVYWYNESAPNAHVILGIVVAFELAILTTDQVFEFLEEREAKKLEEKLNTMHEMTTALSEGRHLSNSQKLAWKLALSRFAPQPFKVLQIGVNDMEASFFARQIYDVLIGCGWVGECHQRLAVIDQRMIFKGVTVHMVPAMDEPWKPEAANAVGEILNQIRTCGIKEGSAALPEGILDKWSVVVAVGEQP